MATNGHDRAHLLPFENGSILSDRTKLNRNENGINGIRDFSDGWELSVVYVVGVSFVLFFAKIRYKIKK